MNAFVPAALAALLGVIVWLRYRHPHLGGDPWTPSDDWEGGEE